MEFSNNEPKANEKNGAIVVQKITEENVRIEIKPLYTYLFLIKLIIENMNIERKAVPNEDNIKYIVIFVKVSSENKLYMYCGSNEIFDHISPILTNKHRFINIVDKKVTIKMFSNARLLYSFTPILSIIK